MAYNVTVDHARRIMAVHGAFPGARNDKTIARTDPAIRAVRFNPLYLEHTFSMQDARGRQMTMSGVMCMITKSLDDCLIFYCHSNALFQELGFCVTVDIIDGGQP